MGEDKEEKEAKGMNSFAKYSAMAFQMLATIGLFAFIGYQLDKYTQQKVLIYTSVLGIVGVAASLYQVVRTLNKNK
ncbi:AtpZ/AtpI family protein [Pedobacter montanisoli]|uniref:AtpZ/AtpI family protein n=1 Tax=Pedobacter montanisoli TaxID=2923277 RepID=A0ABS9ZVC3_9SPHI|nr:AtpZ/AtpI family protein [Pedobacter montanisoli]MCJ0741299.1 AtpZ/AtpI family protein [Pedobacter montanisoli]